jgi:hypothetical protein
LAEKTELTFDVTCGYCDTKTRKGMKLEKKLQLVFYISPSIWGQQRYKASVLDVAGAPAVHTNLIDCYKVEWNPRVSHKAVVKKMMYLPLLDMKIWLSLTVRNQIPDLELNCLVQNRKFSIRTIHTHTHTHHTHTHTHTTHTRIKRMRGRQEHRREWRKIWERSIRSDTELRIRRPSARVPSSHLGRSTSIESLLVL